MMNKHNEALQMQNLEYYEIQYTRDLLKYFRENEDNNEIDFIDEKITSFYNKIAENERIFKLSNEEFYAYLIENVPRYKTVFEERSDKQELKEQVFNERLDYERSFYSPSLIYEQKIEFYKLKLRQLLPNTKNSSESTLVWKGTDLQFAELAKALKESNLVSPELNQKELFSRLKIAFSVNDFNESDKLRELRKRTTDVAPFINLLYNSLEKWVKLKD